MDQFNRDLHSHNGQDYVKDLVEVAKAVSELVELLGNLADSAMANFVQTIDLNVNRLSVDRGSSNGTLYSAALDAYNEEDIDYPIITYTYRTRQKDVKSVVCYLYVENLTINEDGQLEAGFAPEIHFTYTDGRKRVYDGTWHDEEEA
jgi:hypothetical protein